MSDRLSGTSRLLRLALLRDRALLPPLVGLFVLVSWSSAAAADTLYPDRTSLVAGSEGWNATAAVVALHGRIYDPASLGSAALVKLTGLGTALLALVAGLLVVRHTRADEELGRTELAASGVVGRYAALAAAFLVAAVAVTGVAVGSALALGAAGLPWPGSAAFGAAWGGAGLVAAALAAVAAQVARTARGARGALGAVLGVLYLVRAVGDSRPADGARWLHWLSPFGWAQQVRPYAGDRWWALLPAALLVTVLVGTAVLLLRRRDLGSGLLPERTGPASTTGLVSVGALSWRLHRGALLGWAVGVTLAASLLGSVAASAGDLLTGPEVRAYLALLGGPGALQDAFLSTELGIVALVVSGFGVAVVLHLRLEETSGRAEALLATATPRTAYAASHVAVALAGTAVLLGLAGLASGTAHALATGDPAQVGRVVGAALARLPAVWVMTGATLALLGVAGRAAPLAWAVLAGAVVLGEFGPLMRLPSWAVEVSPFRHVPDLPGGEVTWAPLLGLTALAVGLLALGAGAFDRRDLDA